MKSEFIESYEKLSREEKISVCVDNILHLNEFISDLYFDCFEPMSDSESINRYDKLKKWEKELVLEKKEIDSLIKWVSDSKDNCISCKHRCGNGCYYGISISKTRKCDLFSPIIIL